MLLICILIFWKINFWTFWILDIVTLFLFLTWIKPVFEYSGSVCHPFYSLSIELERGTNKIYLIHWFDNITAILWRHSNIFSRPAYNIIITKIQGIFFYASKKIKCHCWHYLLVTRAAFDLKWPLGSESPLAPFVAFSARDYKTVLA